MFAGSLCPRGGIAARGFGFMSALARAAMLGRKKARFAIVQLLVGLIAAVAAQAAFAQTNWNVSSGSWEDRNRLDRRGPDVERRRRFQLCGRRHGDRLQFGGPRPGDHLRRQLRGRRDRRESRRQSRSWHRRHQCQHPDFGHREHLGAGNGGDPQRLLTARRPPATLVIAGPVAVNGTSSTGLNVTGNFQITTGGTLENTIDFFTLTSGTNQTNIHADGRLCLFRSHH